MSKKKAKMTIKQLAEHVVYWQSLTPDEIFELEWKLKEIRVKQS